jgi:predicted metal-binding membrane protein
MWVVMMAAMMMPSLVPMLDRYRCAVQRIGSMPLGWLTALVGIGYLLIWTTWGLVLYPLGAALARLEMHLPALARGVPLAIAGIVLIAGALQFSHWKLHYLTCCRQTPKRSCELRGDRSTALCHGLRLGFHCSLSCANLTALLFAGGVMNLGTMVLVAAAITVERIVPNGKRVAQATGIAIIATGLFLAARAIALP